MTRYIINLLLLFACNIGYSQIPLSLSLQPSTPGMSDDIIIEAPIALGDGCIKLDSNIYMVGSDIRISACYLYGFGTSGSIWYDTAHYKIGPLPLGAYTIRYVVKATKGLSDTSCSQFQLIDSVEKLFTVNPTGVFAVNSPAIFCYPNPATNRLQIQSGGVPVSGVNIYNSIGQLVLQQNNAWPSVDIAPLPRGLYIAEVVTPQGNMRKRWVKE